jgi:hypothetical protein
MFADPLSQPHHSEGFTGTLGVPDNAAFAFGDAVLGSLDAEELVVTAGLLRATVEHHEVVNDF